MNAQKAFQDVYTYINECCFEREQEILYMLAAVISGHHVFLIGPPGTGKSMMINRMLRCFADDVTYFEQLLAAETSKSELFGMADIKELRDTGDYKFRYEGLLPTADFVNLEEIWKCNSGTLNALLMAINERRFQNGTESVDIPLKTMFCSSNELPQDESLGALYDRLAVRMEIPNLLKTSSKLKIVDRMDGTDVEPDAPQVLTLDVLEAASKEAGAIRFDSVARRRWPELQQRVKQDLAGTCYVSDRRWGWAYQVLKAVVWLNGGAEITKDDFIYMTDLLWEEPKQRSSIAAILSDFMGAVTSAGQECYNRVAALHEAVITGEADIFDVWAEVKDARREMDELVAEGGGSALMQNFENKFDQVFEDLKEIVEENF